MKQLYRLAFALALLGSVVPAPSAAQATSVRCYGCNQTFGCFLLPPGGGPGWSECFFTGDVCIVEGNCPFTVPSEVDVSGTVTPVNQGLATGRVTVVQAALRGTLREGVSPGATWGVRCKGEVVTRSMSLADGLALRTRLREIRL